MLYAASYVFIASYLISGIDISWDIIARVISIQIFIYLCIQIYLFVNISNSSIQPALMAYG